MNFANVIGKIQQYIKFFWGGFTMEENKMLDKDFKDLVLYTKEDNV